MPEELTWTTPGGVTVRRRTCAADPVADIAELTGSLDRHRGVLLTSDVEHPGRYTRWSRGFVAPPLAVTARGVDLTVEALDERGLVLLDAAGDLLAGCSALRITGRSPRAVACTVVPGDAEFNEEHRFRQPSVFSAVRALVRGFSGGDGVLGLYGAFGYDLVFPFDRLAARSVRDADQRDMVLYLPDDVVVVGGGTGWRHRYEFEYGGRCTAGRRTGAGRPSVTGLPGDGARRADRADWADPAVASPRADDGPPFAAGVERAKEAFRRGDLFEVVLTTTFRAATTERPSAVHDRLRRRNPAPYGGLLNLGSGECLVSGSPEMFVRVTGDRVETCPISGTITRGRDALEDSELIRTLLNSAKDEAELTMCTDVDRNDKARVCVPGSVRVIGRRQIETYARVIHTVDHVEGRLRPGLDGIDAFLSHMWAVTVTGAPKLWAMRFIEEHEAGPRRWYGGAIGYLGFDGDLDTGLTLRTIRLAGGQAEVRAGGTLLHDSIPLAEEEEVRLKAAAFLDAVAGRAPDPCPRTAPDAAPLPPGARVLILDCEDSFVHTLGDYVRQAGAEVQTVRAPLQTERLHAALERFRPALLLVSPGPGRPGDFGLDEVVSLALARGLPLFGVCLGLQAIGEHFGGRLRLLDEPVHGKPGVVLNRGGRFFDGEPAEFRAGRYHSLHLRCDELPPVLHATGWTADGVVMQLEHATLPVAAVQFHPESIMTAGQGQGMRLLRCALGRLMAVTMASAA